MAYLPLNLLFAGFFLFGVAWGWEGDEMRQFFAIVSSIFMLSLWNIPLFSIVESGGVQTFISKPGWIPTLMLGNILFWNVVLMYFTTAHLMETLGRSEPIGKALKRLRKAQ